MLKIDEHDVFGKRVFNRVIDGCFSREASLKSAPSGVVRRTLAKQVAWMLQFDVLDVFGKRVFNRAIDDCFFRRASHNAAPSGVVHRTLAKQEAQRQSMKDAGTITGTTVPRISSARWPHAVIKHRRGSWPLRGAA